MTTALTKRLTDAWSALGAASDFALAGPVNRLLRVSPRPLIHPDARMIVLFSPKSACSNVVIWFLHQLGLDKEAQAYHPWPHRYRAGVYYKSDPYLRALKMDLTDFRVVRVVRDPFDRAASSFRHVQRSGLTDKHFAALLDRADAATAGISFCEYLDLLEHVDLTTCNAHYRIQRHPLEDRLPVTHLINISTQDLYARLNEVEADLGLPVTDFDSLQWLQSLSDRRGRFDGKIDATDAYTMRLTRRAAHGGPWPPYETLLTPVARERIARLYATDIAAYEAR